MFITNLCSTSLLPITNSFFLTPAFLFTNPSLVPFSFSSLPTFFNFLYLLDNFNNDLFCFTVSPFFHFTHFLYLTLSLPPFVLMLLTPRPLLRLNLLSVFFLHLNFLHLSPVFFCVIITFSTSSFSRDILDTFRI